MDKLYSSERLDELLRESDFVTLQLPLTKETEAYFGEEQFRSMKRTAYFINAARGRIVKEEALVRALDEGWIAGAALDTFDAEPLPQHSLLWGMKNVIVTPHVAGITPYYGHRLIELFCDNLKRFLNGEPMINVVDKTRGY